MMSEENGQALLGSVDGSKLDFSAGSHVANHELVRNPRLAWKHAGPVCTPEILMSWKAEERELRHDEALSKVRFSLWHMCTYIFLS